MALLLFSVHIKIVCSIRRVANSLIHFAMHNKRQQMEHQCYFFFYEIHAFFICTLLHVGLLIKVLVPV